MHLSEIWHSKKNDCRLSRTQVNSKLLDLEPKITEEDINSMTEEQKTAMLLKLLTKK